MRLVVGVLACIAAGVLGVAVADPAPEQSAQAASSPSTGAPAAPAPAAPQSDHPAPTVAKPAVNPEEKRLIAMGYKPEMRNGEKVFCRLVEETGSRLGGRKQCGTPQELKAAQTATREEVEKAQRIQGMPGGK